jgi:signal transduction histidine kinase
MENVVEIFGQKIDTLRRRIPADELRIRQELDLLTGYWREVVTKTLAERESLVEEKLKMRDEEFRRLNSQLFQREQEWKVEFSRKSEEGRILFGEKLKLKEEEYRLRESKLLQREDEWKRECQLKKEELRNSEREVKRLEKILSKQGSTGLSSDKQELEPKLQPQQEEILILNAKIKTLENRLVDQASTLTAESGKTIARENENFINLTRKLREEWAIELNKRLKQQYSVMKSEQEKKDKEITRLKDEAESLQVQITYEHQPWEARVKTLQEENKVLQIDMRKELTNRMAGLEEEYDKFKDLMTKQRDSIRAGYEKTLDTKEEEIAKLKEQVVRFEQQITEGNQVLRIDLRKKLTNKIADLEEESNKFKDLTAKQRDGIITNYEKRAEEQSVLYERTLAIKEKEIAKLKEQFIHLENQMIEENQVLKIDMRKELIKRIVVLAEENNKFIDLMAKQKNSIRIDYERELGEHAVYERTLAIKEKEIAKLKGQIIHFEDQIAGEFIPLRTKVKLLEEEEEKTAGKLEELQNTEKKTTELKNQLNEARNIIKKKDESYNIFFENISRGFGHRLRNYLGIISSAVQSCQTSISSYKMPQQQNSKLPYTYLVEKNINKLIIELKKDFKVIMPILNDITKLAQGFGSLACVAKISLSPALISRVLDNIYPAIENKCREQNITLFRQYEDNLPKIMADQKYLEEAFSNIVINSIEAMPQGGKLTVQAELDETKRNIVIRFIDNGEGISERILNKIFQPYLSAKKGKEGLGLSKARNIIEFHQGNISIESEKDKGTTVTVILPVA